MDSNGLGNDDKGPSPRCSLALTPTILSKQEKITGWTQTEGHLTHPPQSHQG